MEGLDVLQEVAHTAHKSWRNVSFSDSTVTHLCLFSDHLQLQANDTVDTDLPTTSQPTREPGCSPGPCKSPLLPYPTVQRKTVTMALTWKFTSFTQTFFSAFRTSIKPFVSHGLLVSNKVRYHGVISVYQRPH